MSVGGGDSININQLSNILMTSEAKNTVPRKLIEPIEVNLEVIEVVQVVTALASGYQLLPVAGKYGRGLLHASLLLSIQNKGAPIFAMTALLECCTIVLPYMYIYIYIFMRSS